MGLDCPGSLIFDYFSINTIFHPPYDFLNTFSSLSLLYCNNEYVINIKCKICVNWQFMLSVKSTVGY